MDVVLFALRTVSLYVITTLKLKRYIDIETFHERVRWFVFFFFFFFGVPSPPP